MRERWLFLLWGVLLVTGAGGATDSAREQRIAEQIEDSVLVGSPLRLQAGGQAFFALHAESAAAQRYGGVVLLHGRGANPDWTEVIQPLRSELPERGWETLSIQLPVASVDAAEGAYQALIPEAFPRIQAAVEFLQQRDREPILLVGHSLGARMGVEFLAAGEPPAVIQGLVAIGLSADRRERDSGVLAALSRVRLPLLDIYGSRDSARVVGSSDARAAAAMRAANERYRQLEVPGADHFFTGMDEELITRVNAWMRATLAR